MKQPILDLGPSLEDLPLPPTAERVIAEHRELMRIAAVSALDNGGKHLTAAQLADVKEWAAIRPLNRPLGTGEPTT